MGTCVYDSSLLADCTTPVSSSYSSAASQQVSTQVVGTGCPSPSGYDIYGNFCPGVSFDQYGYPVGTQTGTVAANPVAGSVASSNGGTALSTSLLNFASAIAPTAIKAATGTSTTTGLILQTNPATGTAQYYNPATGLYVAGPVNTSGLAGLFTGTTGIILLIVALVIGFFAFGGKRRSSE